MRFNIKEWQEKYLISEAKLRELEFADQEGFKKYSSKHKVNPSTKVTIGGKQTSAGQASKSSSGGAATKKYREVSSEDLGDILSNLDQESQDMYDDGGQANLVNHMENAFEAAGLFDSDGPITYKKISDAVDAYDGFNNEKNPNTGKKWTPSDIRADKKSIMRQLQGELEALSSYDDDTKRVDKADDSIKAPTYKEKYGVDEPSHLDNPQAHWKDLVIRGQKGGGNTRRGWRDGWPGEKDPEWWKKEAQVNPEDYGSRWTGTKWVDK